MFQDVTLGQYFPGDSILHRLDPRTKIFSLLALLVMIFSADDPIEYLMLTATVGLLVALSRINVTAVLRAIKPLRWIILFTFVIHLVSHDGELLFRAWIFNVTDEGLREGFLISLRLVLMIVASSLLTFTTSPLKLTDATERLLTPLKVIGVPAHELAMMMTIALRFIPTLLDEADKIIKAQKIRGLDIEHGNFINRLKMMVPILVPLFLSAFRRADDLAMAMEARCYRGGEGRTHMKSLAIGSSDWIALAVVALMVVAFVWIK
ncbi:MAG: energy-coupling factor transporter transmembrane protein EcfT [Selenomonadaceae bacterium]|nr:energy-coupling factor transporter transmembrane protein EcfT [Selenomonadaceae bacterium]